MAIKLHLSGDTNNTSTFGSLGGRRSTTEVTTNVSENVFDNISRQEALTSKKEYRCLYVYNDAGSTLTNVRITLTHPAITNIAIGIDPVGKGDGSDTGIATTITTENVAPAGVTFVGEEEDVYELPLGYLKAGEGIPVWFRREAETSTDQTITWTLTITEDAGTLPSTSAAENLSMSELRDMDVKASGTFTVATALIGFSDIG